MKYPRMGSLGLKITAVVLLFLSEALTLICALGVYGEAHFDVFTASDFFESSACEELAASEARGLEYNIQYGDISTVEQAQDYLDRYYQSGMTNFGIQILDSETGAVLAENTLPQTPANTYVFGYEDCTIRVLVSSTVTVHDSFYEAYRMFNFIKPLRYAIVVGLVFGAALFLTCLIFLFCAAGHRRGEDGIILNAVDKIPLDLLLAFYLAVSTVAVAVSEDTGMEWVLLGISAVLIDVMALSFCLSLATRMKAGELWKNTVICRLLLWLKKVLFGTGGWIRRCFRAIPLIWKAALLVAALFFAELLLAVGSIDGSGFVLLLFLAFNFLLFLAICYGVLQMRLLQRAGERLAAGDFEYQVDTSKMCWDLKQHGDNLNSIGAGMAIALSQEMKSERLKTELITNVSHDIKTPLTSIINYADLLQQEHLTEEERQDYLETLSRQSRRLKKLTEDLVEASKASTGNIPVALVPTNVGELVNQAVAEYADRFSAGALETVVQVSGENLTVQADGRLLWRILDNLLGNACKYAMPGTRVYLDARPVGSSVVISVKNVSRAPLNINADELMERFVRGDTARTTEGSGLGLSIARSLAELQKGTFSIVIDGDLFKAEVALNP
ncbi:MAG: HAMP domain-containing sensor histidine kinase [Oscillospiraceae bacterium]|nr:HAMP domain-containing sensor histidine kinase [Oscillospiraceae bacterium]